MSTCSICLEDLKNPVATPCGHLHCERCTARVIQSSNDVVNMSCPTCRTSFCIAQPDLRFVPAKYHKFIIPSIRRVYIQAGPQTVASSSTTVESSEPLAVDEDEILELKDQINTLDQRVAALTRDKVLLMDRCDRYLSASSHHANKERVARLENDNLKQQVADLKKQLEETKAIADERQKRYDGLKWRLQDFKNRLESPPSNRSASKRTSAQAALDGTFLARAHGGTDEQDDNQSNSRPVLPMPKRPRLCSRPRHVNDSPDPLGLPSTSKLVPPPIFKKRSPRSNFTPEEQKLLPRSPTPYVTPKFMSSASRSAMDSSAMLPARSGLPAGDLFSPTRNVQKEDSDDTGHGSIDFENGVAVMDAEPGSSDATVDQERKRKYYTFRGSKMVSVGKHKFSKVETEE